MSQAGLRVEVSIRNRCSSVHPLISLSQPRAKSGQAGAWHLGIGWEQVDTTGAISAAALTQAKSSTQPRQVGVDTIQATHTLGMHPPLPIKCAYYRTVYVLFIGLEQRLP